MSSNYVNPDKDECKKHYLTDNNLDTYGCTNYEDEPTLTFNLETTSIISFVVIINRLTTIVNHADRLNNAKITAKLGSETVKVCGTVTTTTDYTIAGQTYKINCGTIADKVVISTTYKTAKDPKPVLNIAEVMICGKIFGKLRSVVKQLVSLGYVKCLNRGYNIAFPDH